MHEKLTDSTLVQASFNELQSTIQEYAGKREQVVVPDRELHLFPFSALVSKGAYVLSSHAVDVTPSSTTFEIFRRQSAEKECAEMQYIGFAAWTQEADTRNPILRAISSPERSEFVPPLIDAAHKYGDFWCF